MSGEKNIDVLLRGMEPVLVGGAYVFCTVPLGRVAGLLECEPVLIFREAEGATLILAKESADRAGLSYESEWGMITLKVHSSLNAVGFLAKITNALAGAQISVNAVSAYYHDHLFVPFDRRDEAMDILRVLSKASRSK